MSEKEKISSHVEERVSLAFIKDLNDKNLNVQSAAVNAIQRTAGLLDESNLLQLSQTLASTVADPNSPKDSRDVFSNAIRCIISEFEVQAGAKLIKDLLPRLQGGLHIANTDVQEDCLEIMIEIFSKFTLTFEQNPQLVNKAKILKDVMALLDHSELKVSKNAALCLGATADILNQQQVNELVQSLRSATDDVKSEGELLATLQALANVTRTAGAKLGNQSIVIISEMAAYPRRLSAESKDMDNEIAEASLSTIENLVRMNPASLDSVKTLYSLTKEYISHDPQFIGDANEDADMEADEDDGWGDDDDFGCDNEAADIDDSAWKVRKASVRIIDALAVSCGSQLRKCWQELL